MASDLRLRVGNASATITFQATDQQVATALRRFAGSLGIPVDGVPQENLLAILEHFRSEVVERSKAMQRAELRSEYDATIEATVEADNAL